MPTPYIYNIYQSVAACTVHPFAGDCPKGTAAAQRNAEAEPVCLDAHTEAELLNAVRCEDSYTRNEKHSMKYRSINWCSKISAVCNCSIIFSRKTDIFLYLGVTCPCISNRPKTTTTNLGSGESCHVDLAHHILFHQVALNLLFDASGCVWNVWVPLAPNSWCCLRHQVIGVFSGLIGEAKEESET